MKKVNFISERNHYFRAVFICTYTLSCR